MNKGNSHNLMKITAQRRRSKKQIQADKDAEETMKAETEEKLGQFDIMQEQIRMLQ